MNWLSSVTNLGCAWYYSVLFFVDLNEDINGPKWFFVVGSGTFVFDHSTLKFVIWIRLDNEIDPEQWALVIKSHSELGVLIGYINPCICSTRAGAEHPFGWLAQVKALSTMKTRQLVDWVKLTYIAGENMLFALSSSLSCAAFATVLAFVTRYNARCSGIMLLTKYFTFVP